MLGLCLTAMFVLVAFGASGAQASLPEIGKCEATAGNTGGKYKNAGCTERASRKKVGENEYVYYGGFEWTPLKSPSACESLAGHPGGFYSDAACTEKAPKVKGVYQGNYESSGFGVVTGHKATLGGTGTATYETQVGKKMTCTTLGRGTSVQFTVNGAKTPFWEFAGCESKGQECLTPFSAVEVGEVNDYVPWYFEAHFEELPEAGEPVPGWDGKLGYIEGKHTSPVVGMAWTARNNERFYEPIECESEATGTVWIGGNKRGGNTIIAQMTPVNQMTTHYTETYSSPSPGVQAVKQFESQHSPYALQAFVGNEWEPVALNATFNYTTDRAIE
ncbi:MAG TPA: hypothetical protein VES65_05925, partial [Solirubrobacteraceae bacterium]|nr:hypothetical protein [Solirubrobacteraceae bacterium]